MNQDKKHIGKFVQIPMDLYAPRWNVLKVNIEHSQNLLNCARAIGSHEKASIHKRSIFQQLEELNSYNYLFN